MIIKIDFQSDEALYVQLRNQIIMGIANASIQEGDVLPSVRQLADDIGINMHTVNKAYSVLRQEGFVTIDRRKGAVIALDANKLQAVNEAYSVLRQEGFVTIDRRKGAVVSLDVDKLKALEEMRRNLRVLLAKGCCKHIICEEVHQLVDEIFSEYEQQEKL